MVIKDIISQIWSKTNDKISTLTYADVGASPNSHIHSGESIHPHTIELLVNSDGQQGYIDIHDGTDGNSRDYFGRITTDANNCLQFFVKADRLSDSFANCRSLSIHSYNNTGGSWEKYLTGYDYTTNEQIVFYNDSEASVNARHQKDVTRAYDVLNTNAASAWASAMPTGIYSTYSSTAYAWKDKGIPREYAHILSAKENILSQLCFTPDSLWYRMSWGNGWSSSSAQDANGWTRIAVADANGNVRGAVYN